MVYANSFTRADSRGGIFEWREKLARPQSEICEPWIDFRGSVAVITWCVKSISFKNTLDTITSSFQIGKTQALSTFFHFWGLVCESYAAGSRFRPAALEVWGTTYIFSGRTRSFSASMARYRWLKETLEHYYDWFRSSLNLEQNWKRACTAWLLPRLLFRLLPPYQYPWSAFPSTSDGSWISSMQRCPTIIWVEFSWALYEEACDMCSVFLWQRALFPDGNGQARFTELASYADKFIMARERLRSTRVRLWRRMTRCKKVLSNRATGGVDDYCEWRWVMTWWKF